MKRQGFTLLEIVVAAALLSLIILITVQIMLPAMRVFVRSQARAALDQSARIVEARLQADLEVSNADTVAFVNRGGGQLAFMQPDNYDENSGRPRWARFVAYFVKRGTGDLIRREWPGKSGALTPSLPYQLPSMHPIRLTDDEVDLLCSTPNGTERRVSSLLAGFRVQLVEGQPMVLEVDLETPSRSSSGLEKSQIRLSLRVRN